MRKLDIARRPAQHRLAAALGTCVFVLTIPAILASLWPHVHDGDVRARVMPLHLALGTAAIGLSLLLQARERTAWSESGRIVALAAAALGAMACLRLDVAGLGSPGAPSMLDRAGLLPDAIPLALVLVGGSLALSADSRLAVGLATLALAIAMGSAFNAIYDAKWAQLEMSADGVAAFLLASFGALARHREGFLAKVLDDDASEKGLVPISLAGALLVPSLLGALSLEGKRAGWYEEGTQTALLVLGSTLALGAFVFGLSARLRRVDRQRRQATAAIVANEVRYRHIFDRASVGIAQLTPDGRWQHANEKLCAMLGYTRAELREKTYGELSHLDDVTLDAQQWEMLRRGDVQDYGVERRFISKQGEVIHAEVRLVREADANGALRFTAVLQDVTNRKVSENSLRVYERAITASQNAIVITDASKPDHPIVSVNPAFVAMTGFPAEEAIGRNCRFLNEKAREQPGLEELRRALRAMEPCSVLVLNHRANGEEFWNHVSIAPLHDADGRVTHWVGTLVDATAVVRALQERESLLAAAQEGQQMAEAASRAKDRFLTLISHELRSPMSAIKTWSALLRDEVGSPAQRRALDAIDASLQAQTRLVDDLMVAARLRTETISIEFSDVDLVAGIEATVQRLLPAAEESGVALDLHLPLGRASCYADLQRVEQILHNLIGNAIKFTPAGGRVSVALHDDRDRWSIEVRDTGRGLRREDLARVFDEFWQADRTEQSGGAKGLGLGLAIVKSLVERLGGTVRAESAGPGMGSTFRVELPKRAATGTPQASGSAEGVDLGGMGVVVVEDDPELLGALGVALSHANARPRLATSVPMALELLAGDAPQVLISDIGLPERDGLELIRIVRASEEPMRSICALAVTGRADLARRARRAGFDGCLAKPVEPRVVIGRVAELRARLADPRPPVRKLLVLGDDRLTDPMRALRDGGHDVRSVTDLGAVWDVALERRPDAILLPGWIEAAAVSELIDRLLAVNLHVPCIGLLERDVEREENHFDFVAPMLDSAALGRVLRLVGSPWH